MFSTENSWTSVETSDAFGVRAIWESSRDRGIKWCITCTIYKYVEHRRTVWDFIAIGLTYTKELQMPLRHSAHWRFAELCTFVVTWRRFSGLFDASQWKGVGLAAILYWLTHAESQLVGTPSQTRSPCWFADTASSKPFSFPVSGLRIYTCTARLPSQHRRPSLLISEGRY